MNREILFRGKRTDNGEWITSGNIIHTYDIDNGEEFFIPKHNSPCMCKKDNNKILTIEKTIFYKVVNETVGQYTGLTDKNGKKIFEGDIVKGDREYFTYTHHYGRVIYDGGQFLIAFDDVLEDIECLGAWANAVEVIGNIHDNPELLEG